MEGELDPQAEAGPAPSGSYPVGFAVEYPDRELDRLSSALRIFWLIPIAILFTALTGSGGPLGDPEDAGTTIVVGGIGLLFVPVALMILFREKYPRWWFDWNLNLQRFASRIGVFAALMDDRYPATDEEQAVRLDYPYPDVRQDLNRWLPLVKWLLAIPHYIVLVFLYLGLLFAVIGAWFAILFTGRYPRGLFGYAEGVMRWHNRVVGYAFALVTDDYPPFRLSP